MLTGCSSSDLCRLQCCSGLGKQPASGHNHYTQLCKLRRLWPAVGNCNVGHCTRMLQNAPYGPPSAEGGGAHTSSRLLNTSGKRSVDGARVRKIGWMGLSFMGHYPPSCMALVKLSETLKNLAWYFVSTLYRIGGVRTHARRGTEVLTWAPIVYCSTDACQTPARS